MNTEINRFCKRYAEKLKNDKDIKENPTSSLSDNRDRISFRIAEFYSTPGTVSVGSSSGINLFYLDAEDLKHLYDKYSKKLQEEMNQNLEKVKQMYEIPMIVDKPRSVGFTCPPNVLEAIKQEELKEVAKKKQTSNWGGSLYDWTRSLFGGFKNK